MTRARCSDHKSETNLPLDCQTCVRISLEQRIVRKTVKALLDEGYQLQVWWDGESQGPRGGPTGMSSIILAELCDVDEERLYAFKDGAKVGWVQFTYGNDGWDVISDHTLSLRQALEPALTYAKKAEQ